MSKILLGITGSVAAIKVESLLLALRPIGEVRLVVTQQSCYFIQAHLSTWQQQAITIYQDQDEWPAVAGNYQPDPQQSILHIELRRWADGLVIAPLDAHTLAKIAQGLCDNLLTNLVRAWDWQKPIILCPAMNTMMWHNPPTAEQLQCLTAWGAHIVPPVIKQLACQEIGMGAMAPVEEIVRHILRHIRQTR